MELDLDGGGGGGGYGGDAGAAGDDWAVFQPYIAAMLGNLGSLPLDRMHNTLKMFASMGDTPYEHTTSELARFLGSLVKADTLELTDGLYSLKR
jgi:anaphase-promoting complex subunit 2